MLKLETKSGRVFNVSRAKESNKFYTCIHEDEWFPEPRKDILYIFFAKNLEATLTSGQQIEPSVGDLIFIDFNTTRPCGNGWHHGPIVSITEVGNERSR